VRKVVVEPTRVAYPQDQPKVERHTHHIRERFWKGGTFAGLAEVRAQAGRWCPEVAGQRVHGTARRVPRVVFEDQERSTLLPLRHQAQPGPSSSHRLKMGTSSSAARRARASSQRSRQIV
jgi:hypothetical protein